MKLRLVKEPFDDADLIWKLKHDGWRGIAYVERGECRLVSRNFRNLQFKSLGASLAVSVRNAVIDGEIVCLDGNGVSQFNSLLSNKGRDAAAFYAFDLPWLNDEDLRQLPLLERKARLRELVTASRCSRLLYAQHIEGAGKKFFEEICRRDLEGVVGKRKTGLYREDRDDWVKVSCKTGKIRTGPSRPVISDSLPRARPVLNLNAIMPSRPRHRAPVLTCRCAA